MNFCRSIVRLSILKTSGCRILSNGGATTFDPVMGGASTSSSSGGSLNGGACGGGGKEPGSEARAREVFAAFAAFRETHCFAPPRNRKSKSHHASLVIEKSEKVGNKNEIEQPASTPRLLWWEEEEKEKEELDLPQTSVLPSPVSETRQEQGQIGTALSHNTVEASPKTTSIQALKQLEQETALRQAAAYRRIILGELFHILRPVLYVAALRRWGRRSWKPWALSLALELGSARLTAAGAAASHRAAADAARSPAVAGTALAALYGMQGIQWRREELDEITRRKLQLLFALLRDPFFARVTGPAVERWEKRLDRVPLIGRLSNKAVELLLGVQKYYSYTSGS